MDYTNFIEQYYPNTKGHQLFAVKKICDRYDRLINGNIENAANIDIKNLYELFRYEDGRVSKTYFYETRQILVNLYKFIGKANINSLKYIHYIENIKFQDIACNYENSIHYFKNLEEIDELFLKVKEDYNLHEEDDFINVRVAIYLLWIGINANDIINIKKEHINLQESKIFIEKTKEYVLIDEHSLYFLERYLNIKQFRVFPKTRINCVDSTYLFRNHLTSQMTLQSFSNTLARFNVSLVKYNKQFTAPRLYLNGIYSRIYELEQKGYDEKEAIKKITSDKDMSYTQSQYSQWKASYNL